MKKLIILLSMVIFTTSLMAQPKQQPRMGGNSGGFANFQIEMIVKQLQLNEKQVEPFKKLYTEYSERMNAIQRKPHRRDDEQGRQSLTDTEIEKQILESFDMVEQNNTLKREYYYKFKEIISVQQIMRMYNVERRLRERMLSESTRRSDN